MISRSVGVVLYNFISLIVTVDSFTATGAIVSIDLHDRNPASDHQLQLCETKQSTIITDNFETMMEKPYEILELTTEDEDIVWQMLTHASHENSVESVKSQHPVLTQYASDFCKRDGDFGVVAIDRDSRDTIGAAWVRLLRGGYAYVQDDIPELAIAVVPAMRSQGVGRDLLSTLLKKLSSSSTPVPAVSLSCRQENTVAMSLYERIGFETIPSSVMLNARSRGKSVTMIYRLDHGVIIRKARPEDVSVVMDLIRQKSEFDRCMGSFDGEISVTEEKLFETVLTTTTGSSVFPPYAEILLAERRMDVEEKLLQDGPSKQGERNVQPVGFACVHFRYSSFTGRPSIWLDDLFVESAHRSHGVGLALMTELKQLATKVHNATHIGWTADARNSRGLQFYHKLGATITEQRGNRCFLEWKNPSL